MDLVHGEAAQGKIEYICNYFIPAYDLQRKNFLLPYRIYNIGVDNNQQILMSFKLSLLLQCYFTDTGNGTSARRSFCGFGRRMLPNWRGPAGDRRRALVRYRRRTHIDR